MLRSYNEITGSIIKRMLDIVVSIIVLIVLSPLVAVVALLVMVNVGTPVFFRQQRPGLYAKPFYIYKFRTMLDLRDASGNLLPDASRMTQFGTWLRETSLDEVPQFLNVLKGEMSLVGPRPLLMEYLELYTPEQAKRHLVKPGMVSIGGVNGRNQLTWEEKFASDIYYLEHWSLMLDFEILVKTVGVVLGRQNVNHSGSATMPKFEGNSNKKVH